MINHDQSWSIMINHDHTSSRFKSFFCLANFLKQCAGGASANKLRCQGRDDRNNRRRKPSPFGPKLEKERHLCSCKRVTSRCLRNCIVPRGREREREINIHKVREPDWIITTVILQWNFSHFNLHLALQNFPNCKFTSDYFSMLRLSSSACGKPVLKQPQQVPFLE